MAVSQFTEGEILLWLGVGLLCVLRAVRAWSIKNGSVKWTEAPADLLYRILDMGCFALMAAGLVRALSAHRSWAHEDDIIAIIASTFALAWATTPGIGASSYTNVGAGESKLIPNLMQFLVLCCCAGAYILLGFIGGRGKSVGDRTMIWVGIGCVGAAGPVTQAFFNMLDLKDDSATIRGVLGGIESVGWALFASGALMHELDLEAPVGFMP